MKIKTVVYITIPTILVVLFVVLFVITKPVDEKCKEGSSKRDGKCTICTPNCPSGFDNGVGCGCACGPIINGGDDSPRTFPIDSTTGEITKLNDKDFPEPGTTCVKNYCSVNQKLNGFAYNFKTGDCNSCPGGVKPSPAGDDTPSFCCDDGEAWDEDRNCCQASRSYSDDSNDPENPTAACCPSGHIAVFTETNGDIRDRVELDGKCKGSVDFCCAENCGTTGHENSKQGAGFCSNGWGCQPEYGFKTKEDAEAVVARDITDENNKKLVDGPNKCGDEWEIAYCEKGYATQNHLKRNSCDQGGGVLLGDMSIHRPPDGSALHDAVIRRGLADDRLPTREKTFFNINMANSELVIPDNMLAIAGPISYNDKFNECAIANNSSTRVAKGCASEKMGKIWDHIQTNNISFDEFINKYNTATKPHPGSEDRTTGGYYVEIKSNESAAWTNFSSFDADNKDDCDKKSIGTLDHKRNSFVFSNGATNKNCLAFYDGVLKKIDNNDKEALLENCRGIIGNSTSFEDDDALGKTYFRTPDLVPGPRCLLDGQIANHIEDGPVTKYVSTSKLASNQTTPYMDASGNPIIVGGQLVGEVRKKGGSTIGVVRGSLLEHSGGPACIGVSENAFKSLSWNDPSTKELGYDKKQQCLDKNPCYGGYQRNTKDGVCNIDGCTTTGVIANKNYDYSHPPRLEERGLDKESVGRHPTESIPSKLSCVNNVPTLAAAKSKCEAAGDDCAGFYRFDDNHETSPGRTCYKKSWNNLGDTYAIPGGTFYGQSNNYQQNSWIHGKNGCYRDAPDVTGKGSCRKKAWFFTKGCEESKYFGPTDDATARDFTVGCDAHVDHCNSTLLDGLVDDFIPTAGSPDYYWCRSKKDWTTQNCGTGMCVDQVHDGKLHFVKSNPTSDMITSVEDDRRGYNECKNINIPK
jgi:hypothetical protein